MRPEEFRPIGEGQIRRGIEKGRGSEGIIYIGLEPGGVGRIDGQSKRRESGADRVGFRARALTAAAEGVDVGEELRCVSARPLTKK